MQHVWESFNLEGMQGSENVPASFLRRVTMVGGLGCLAEVGQFSGDKARVVELYI